MSEIEYVDPYEGEGPISTTPPPPCNSNSHKICVPPAWGERIPGPTIVRCRCLLCHEEEQHHAIRCIRCKNAPGCCACIWGYMRSQYNSGCPLCRHGDPHGKNPLGADQRRRIVYRRRGRNLVSNRGRREGSMPTCGIGRGQIGGMTTAAGDNSREEEVGASITTNQRGRGQRGRGQRGRGVVCRRGRGQRGRGTTIEGEERKEEEKKE